MGNHIWPQFDRLENWWDENGITKSATDSYLGNLCYESQEVADDSCV